MTKTWPSETRYLQLADVIVDLRYRRLMFEGRSVELPQRVFDLLLLFLKEPHTLHTRAELFDRLWAGTVVEETNLSQNVWLLRKALGEEGKAWICTVAKSGYVFEPPGLIRCLEQLPGALPVTAMPDPAATPIIPATTATEVALATDSRVPTSNAGIDAVEAPSTVALQPTQTTSASPASPIAELVPAPSIRQRRYISLMLALVAMVVVSLAVWRHVPTQNNGSVALVMVQDGASTSSWPAKLLQQWLAWKLDSLPESNVLREAEVATATAPSNVVFLSSMLAANGANKLELHVRLLQDGREERISAVGTPAEMPALVDSLSRQILARLQPQHADPWPALETSAEAAQRYEAFAIALERRDWMTANRLGSQISRLAPRFALLRLQLADALSQLSQTTAAREQHRIASQLLKDSPPQVAALLRARQQALQPGGTEKALRLYQALVDRHPDKVSYRLKLAELLILNGQYEHALSHLTESPDGNEALDVRISKRLLRAQAYGFLGDPVRQRALAIQAQQLARDAGDGWAPEQARAWISRGIAERYQHPERKSGAAFDEAARLYKRVGDATGELYASYLARVTAADEVATDAELNVLLARANSGGHRRIEVSILLNSADRNALTGDAAAYISRLQQAAAIATAAGDPVLMSEVNMRLLNVALLTARLQTAEALVQQQRGLNLRGTARLFTEQYAAALAAIRGDIPKALEIVEKSESLLPPPLPGEHESESRIQIACVRTELLLALGRMDEARTTLEHCRQGERWTARFYAPSVASTMELLAGDHLQAKTLLDQAQASMARMAPDRWLNAIDVARIATRLGEIDRSEHIYAEVLAPLRAAGYTLSIATVLTGQAENAAARGDWQTSRRLAAEARRVVPGNIWSIVSRLDLLAAADARQHGQAAAADLANRLHRRAQALGDAVTELESHYLFGPARLDGDCGVAEHRALVARTGMRGAGLDWLQRDGRRPDPSGLVTAE
ncbi:winged helix-turn-helix domain-containing protein [Pseudomonas sp. CGJS7]|uniref:winged helix-turn-helix domain-containing protein n=1 Tax=Pseudomonas sp. CGJS7 TaxID=3109348 RepID=UPI0030098F07